MWIKGLWFKVLVPLNGLEGGCVKEGSIKHQRGGKTLWVSKEVLRWGWEWF